MNSEQFIFQDEAISCTKSEQATDRAYEYDGDRNECEHSVWRL